LSASEKARQYTIWTETPELGGRLAAYMDPRQVRVYIKDTLLKAYTRKRMADPRRIFRILGLPIDIEVVDIFIKPHGRRLRDGRIIAWSNGTEWKATLMALHERAFHARGCPFAGILFEASTKFPDAQSRVVVETAAALLRVERLVWFD
jgi:hypothetical protein